MVISAILLLILSIAVCFRRDKSIHFSRIVTITTMFCVILAICNLYLIYLNNGIGLYGGLYHITSNTQVFNIFLLIISGIILLLSGFYSRSTLNLTDIMYNRSKITNSKSEHYKILEYPLLLLFIIMGALLLMSTSDLVSIFLSIELQSYGLYLLSTIHRDSESGTKGGLTYFLLGGLSSCFILLSTALIYCNSGTTSLDGLYVISSISDIIKDNKDIIYKSQYIDMSLLILSVGFLFKVSSAPFHFWSPDVYDAIPTIVTTFVAIIAKISIFIFLLELVHYTNNVYSNFNWTFGLLLSCLLSLLIGTIGGLRQFRIKRLFAYSTISHVGFILLALAVSSVESTQAFLFYVMQYSIVNLNAFFIIITVGFSLYNYASYNDEHKELLDKNNSPIQLINQLKGYYYINPILALSLAVTIFSFVGIPPLIGFFGKQMVLSAALDNGYVFLVLIAILTSVISAVYYLSVITQIYFNDTEHYLVNDTTKIKNFILSNSLCLIISLLTLTTILFMFAPKEWLSNANILALILFNP